MKALILTIAVLVVAALLQKVSPVVSGFIAVLPVKILGTAFVSHEYGQLRETLGSMLVWQFVWGFLMLGAYVWLGTR